MSLTGKVALITGASRGIGRACALKLAEDGAMIAINYSNSEDSAKKLQNEITVQGGKAISVQANVAKLDEVERMFKEIEDKLGVVDILVNNAGITADSLLLRMKDEQWDKVMEINLKGVFNCSKIAVKKMLKARKGKIINITSVVGITGNAGQTNYSAAKAGIIGFSKSLAREVADRNILVNCVAPGYIQTDMTKALSDDIKEKLISRIPLGRLGMPEDVAKVVHFLASSSSDYITGQVITVDGGMIM